MKTLSKKEFPNLHEILYRVGLWNHITLINPIQIPDDVDLVSLEKEASQLKKEKGSFNIENYKKCFKEDTEEEAHIDDDYLNYLNDQSEFDIFCDGEFYELKSIAKLYNVLDTLNKFVNECFDGEYTSEVYK